MGVDLPCLAVRLRWPLDDVSFLSFLLPSVFQIPLLIFWSGVSFSFRPTLPFLSFILPFRIRQRNILWRTCSSPHVLPMSFGSAVVHVWGLGASEREGNGRGLGRLALERKVRGSRRGKEAASSTMGRRDRECWRWMVVGGTLRSMTNSVNGKVGQQQIRSTASSVPAISTFGQRRVRSRPSADSVNGQFGPGHQHVRSTASSVPAISTSSQRRVRSRPSARPVNARDEQPSSGDDGAQNHGVHCRYSGRTRTERSLGPNRVRASIGFPFPSICFASCLAPAQTALDNRTPTRKPLYLRIRPCRWRVVHHHPSIHPTIDACNCVAENARTE